MKRGLSICLAVLMIASCLGVCSGCGQRTVYTATYFDTFDTVLTLHVVASSPDEANRISKELHSLVLDLHRHFDIYHEYDGGPNLKTLNDEMRLAYVIRNVSYRNVLGEVENIS